MIPERYESGGPIPPAISDIKKKLLAIVNDTELPQSVRNVAKAELQKLRPEH